MIRTTWSCLCLLGLHLAIAQIPISGQIIDESGNPVLAAAVEVQELSVGTTTGRDGFFQLEVPRTGTYTLRISHISFRTLEQPLDITTALTNVQFILSPDQRALEVVEIRGNPRDSLVPRQNELKISPISARQLPSAFGDFNKVLATLPGVSSNNELSSTYSVRGGNFDENLVYVNDIPIYRPFLANAGRQEGLSFVNPDLVRNISFYAGGWEAKYGDKLSSSLNIEYKEPRQLEGSVTLGLLGGSLYVGGSSPSRRQKYLLGVRHRDSRYLLGTLEVDGQYFPKYTDIQSFITFDLTRKGSAYINRTKLNWLFSYGRNRYLTLPTSQTTEFGSVLRNFRLQTAFIGREVLNYDTYQTGINLTHTPSSRYKVNFIASTVLTRERENYEVEGGYRLCDVDNNPSSGQFDQCVIVRGIGTQFDYGRNALAASLTTLEVRNEWMLDLNTVIEAGVGGTYQFIEDQLDEYSFVDSADYISITSRVDNALTLNNAQVYGYLQASSLSADSVHLFNAGARVNYWSQSGEILISPRLQYQFRPEWRLPTRFNFSIGMYHQHPFYRELRDRTGTVNLDVRAQRSWQAIFGTDQFLRFWNRPFVLSSQLYYKKLWNLNPYEIDNVRIRYYAANISRGYAYGADFRINGAFIPGTQSWFSIGYLRTDENIEGDGRSYIRRPPDQRIKIGVYFEDHMPNDPTLRIYLNLVLGSGFPFGPPGDDQLRNVYQGDEYYRADLGLSKSFSFTREKWIQNLWIRLEVLNALAADNTISYTWIQDVYGTSFAIPNSLSARYFNLKVTADF